MPQTPLEQQKPQKTLGEILRETRVAQGLSLEDVNKKIKLRPVILEYLENDEFDVAEYPSNFMCGYIRSYAKFLSLPESVFQETIDNLKQSQVTLKSNPSADGLYTEHRYSRWIGKISLLIVIVLLSITAIFWWDNYQQQNETRKNLVSNLAENQSITIDDNMMFSPASSIEAPKLETKPNTIDGELESVLLMESPLP